MKQLFLRRNVKPSCLWDSALSQCVCRLSEPDLCPWQHFPWGAIYSAVAGRSPPLAWLAGERVGQWLCTLYSGGELVAIPGRQLLEL